MPRSFVFPDVHDRTPNSPVFLVSPEQVLGFYNQVNRGSQERMVNVKVKNWYMDHALDHGWKKAEFLGNQCLLEVFFS